MALNEILIVDDDPGVAESLRSILKREGFRCRAVESGEAALDEIRKEDFALVLLDMVLPGLSGVETQERIRRLNRDITIIFVTAMPTVESAVEAMKGGAYDYIVKPYKNEDVVMAARRAIEKSNLCRMNELMKLEVRRLNTEVRAEMNRWRRTEEYLSESEDRFFAIVESLPAGVYIHDMEGRLILVNTAACRDTGYSRTHLLKSVISDIEPGACERGGFRELWERLKKGELVSMKSFHVRRDGSEFPVEINLSALNFDGKKVILVLAFDITERARAEEQLRHAHKMDAIGTLAVGVAHDFNNILNVIIGYGVMAMENAGPGTPQRDHIREVIDAADRGANLTRQMLVFSRKQPVSMEPADLNAIVSGVKGMLRRTIGEDVDLCIRLAEGPLSVVADPGQIEQVLMNLAGNARDAMPRGGRLTIETESVGAESDYAKTRGIHAPDGCGIIKVSDDGEGIDPGVKEKIFEPFFTTKEQGKGTGLGLAGAYSVIKQHGGWIECRSVQGEGAVFIISLPLAKDRKVIAGGEPAVPAAGGSETVLIAEDDDSLRNLNRILLESFGYNVITAEDGNEAVERFMENTSGIDLVVLDMVMPGKTGPEAYSAIRETAPGVKAFFMSGYPPGRLAGMRSAEVAEILRKPVSPEAFLQKVRDVLDGANLKAEAVKDGNGESSCC